MANNAAALIEAFRAQCQDMPERSPFYRKDLLDTVADIIYAEYEHMAQQTNIQQKVTDFCIRLGDTLGRAAS